MGDTMVSERSEVLKGIALGTRGGVVRCWARANCRWLLLMSLILMFVTYVIDVVGGNHSVERQGN